MEKYDVIKVADLMVEPLHSLNEIIQTNKLKNIYNYLSFDSVIYFIGLLYHFYLKFDLFFHLFNI